MLQVRAQTAQNGENNFGEISESHWEAGPVRTEKLIGKCSDFFW